jgi:hypothetical protein
MGAVSSKWQGLKVTGPKLRWSLLLAICFSSLNPCVTGIGFPGCAEDWIPLSNLVAQIGMFQRLFQEVQKRHAVSGLFRPLSGVLSLKLISSASFAGEGIPVHLDGIVQTCVIIEAEHMTFHHLRTFYCATVDRGSFDHRLSSSWSTLNKSRLRANVILSS